MSGRHYDIVIIGSGIAGLYTALRAQEFASVLVVTKGRIDDTNTRHAQGGIAAPIARNDSPALHFKDTIAAGAGLCNEEAVRILVGEAGESIADLVGLGVPFDTLNGEITLTMEAAHSVPRILHAGGDATGEHIEVTLSNCVRASRIRVLENSLATDILKSGGRVTGVRVLDSRTGLVDEFDCRYLILATGGAGRLYTFTTNSEIATGDGIALAYHAGAEIADMEFYQFHPTALHLPGVTPFLITEAMRGEGGILRNESRERFMREYAPQAEMAPRDVVARSIVREMAKTGADHMYLDVTHLPAQTITTRFPQIYRFCFEHGLDITRDLIPIAPAAHYMIGGVRTNSWGETNVPGLFACGETTCTGIHGANRLASNSLLEAVVFGKRIVRRIKGEAGNDKPDPTPSIRRTLSIDEFPKPRTSPSLTALQQLNWDKVGIIRDREGLVEAARMLSAWDRDLAPAVDRSSHELCNLILTGRLVAEAALAREESRGAHFRTDLPESSLNWQKHIVFVKG